MSGGYERRRTLAVLIEWGRTLVRDNFFVLIVTTGIGFICPAGGLVDAAWLLLSISRHLVISISSGFWFSTDPYRTASVSSPIYTLV